MQQKKLTLFFVIVLALVVNACTPPTPPQPTITPATPTRPAPEELVIYNWQSYIDPQILKDFEDAYHVKITYQTYASGFELLDNLKVTPDAYDLIFPADYMVMKMRRDNLLAPLNKENIPNLKNLDTLFSNPQYDPDNRFCAAYQWGTAAIAYNRKTTGREITSWGDLFDPQFKGRVSFVESNRTAFGGVLLYLGYSPNTTDEREINEARDFLIAHNDQVYSYLGDDGQDFLVDGKVDIAVEYMGDIVQVSKENPDIQYIIPQEGAVLWTDNMCIPAQARHKDLAEQFINYILDPQVGARLSNYIHYASPNAASLAYLDEEDRTNPIIYPPQEVRDRLFFVVDLGDKTSQLYDTAWEAVLAAHKK